MKKGEKYGRRAGGAVGGAAGDATHELVSCVLATRDRLEFFRQAMRCFLRQSYRPAELIVVDDGERTVEDQCAGREGVRYLRLRRPTALGTKLNLGIEQARGSIIQKLDDDDYYHPDFLKTAVANLPAARRTRSVVAWDCFLVLLAGEKRVRHSGHGWNAGGTLCFDRRLWERGKFRDLPQAVDSWFLLDHRPRIVRVCAPELYLVVRHSRNTWTHMDEVRTNDYFREMPVYPRSLGAVAGRAAAAFYGSLPRLQE